MNQQDFNRAMRKIRGLIKHNVRFQVVNDEDYTAISNERQGKRYVIIVSKEFTSLKRKLYSLLHEVGHFIQLIKNPKIFSSDKYFMIDNKMARLFPLTQEEKSWLLMIERDAWEKGKLVANLLDIEIDLCYDDLRRECIASYEELPEEAKNVQE